MNKDPEYLECHTLRHAWRVMGHSINGTLVLLYLRCARCATEREDVFNRDTGHRVGKARYRWVKGYLRKANDEKITHDGYRAKLVAAITARVSTDS